MTRASRIAFVVVAALLLASCAKLGTSATSVPPADVYAAFPALSDVRSLLGDINWWQGPPSFEVSPLDSATMPLNVRYSIAQQYIHLGTAEVWALRYTVYDKTSSATTRMTDLQNAFGTSPTNPKVGDQVLYYGLGGSGAAPYITRTFVRLGQIVVTIVWAQKDLSVTVQRLGKNADKAVAGLKTVLGSRAHHSLPAVDQKSLPPPALNITYLGSAALPIETWVVMQNLAIPGTGLKLLQDAGVKDFAYGDYALNNDTHMEVRSSLLTFATPTAAADWASAWSPGTPDATGIASGYVPGGGTPAAGEYHYLFISGVYGGELICKPSLDGEAASRECERPMESTAISWKLALGG